MTPLSWLAWLLVAAALPPEQEAERATGMERGLWIGPIPVCRDTVERAEIGTDAFGTSGLTLTFAPHVKPLLLRETTVRAGESVPVRLNGRVIMEPHVPEPIEGRQLFSRRRTGRRK